MEVGTMVGGLVLEAGAWWLVAFRRRDVWRVTVPALVAMGVAALVVGPPEWSPDVPAPAAALGGAAGGAALYAATRAFVRVAAPWDAFRRHSLATYLRQGRRSLAEALLLAVPLTVAGEEIFWRGLFQPNLVEAVDGVPALGAVLAWAAYVVANLPSANLAIVAGAVVGGATWTALGWWCGGALAPMLSHAVWTSLMLSFPVVRSEEVPG
jgi:membrane protease YdiL (CAAX protease family)